MAAGDEDELGDEGVGDGGGVDVGTKLEVYDLIREEAQAGRTFLWYTTETDELKQCDHVYVFRNGAIVADLRRDQLTEQRVIQSSFTEEN